MVRKIIFYNIVAGLCVTPLALGVSFFRFGRRLGFGSFLGLDFLR